MARRKKYYRRKPKKRYYKKKGKKLEGYKLSNFIYPYLIFISVVFWLSVGGFIYLGFIGPEILREFFWFLAGLFALIALIATYQWWRQKRILSQAQTLAYLRQMDPTAFEYYIANLFRKLSFKHVKVMGGSGDRGVDVVAYKKKEKYVIQCKRYHQNKKVTSPELQQFVGSIQIYKADKGIFVTTANYTKEAKAIAKQQNIHLINETELAKLIQRAFGNKSRK